MKIKILGLICLFVFVHCKSPVSPDIDIAKPTIEYFTSTKEFIYSGINSSTALQWRTENADKCKITPDIGEVEMRSFLR